MRDTALRSRPAMGVVSKRVRKDGSTVYQEDLLD
jgi:hypothetical protein